MSVDLELIDAPLVEEEAVEVLLPDELVVPVVVDVKVLDSLLVLKNAVNESPEDAGLNARTDTHITVAMIKKRPRT